ncbi:hypothetical protein TNCV_2338661 [Trichonephila clavipes]|nr:hypothetical protein TNCV_2338661 [Trichonephila clavipes]
MADHHQVVLPQNLGEEQSQHVPSLEWFSKLRLTTGVKLDPCYDEFRGLRFNTVNQVALETTKNRCQQRFDIKTSLPFSV